jgi:hypothetical protein
MERKNEKRKIYIYTPLVDTAHIYIYWNSERNGFLSKGNGFFSRRNGSTRRHGTEERKEKYMYIFY